MCMRHSQSICSATYARPNRTSVCFHFFCLFIRSFSVSLPADCVSILTDCNLCEFFIFDFFSSFGFSLWAVCAHFFLSRLLCVCTVCIWQTVQCALLLSILISSILMFRIILDLWLKWLLLLLHRIHYHLRTLFNFDWGDVQNLEYGRDKIK